MTVHPFKYETREQWLRAAVLLLDAEFFDGRGYKLPKDKIAISVGFARGSSRAIGQCWDPKVTKDGTIHIFVCPTIGDGMRVLDIVLHELIHACVGLKCKHRGAFAKMAREFGLEGKLTATFVTSGSDLHRQLATIYTVLGDYPHSQITGKKPLTGSKGEGEGGEEGEGEEKKRKPWPTFISKREPKYKLQLSWRLVEEFGKPRDPWGEEMVDKDAPKEDEPEPHRFDREQEAEDSDE